MKCVGPALLLMTSKSTTSSTCLGGYFIAAFQEMTSEMKGASIFCPAYEELLDGGGDELRLL